MRLSVESCTKRYGATLALDKVSLDIDRGTIHSIAGVNGSGKSTILKVLSGQVSPDSGTIAVDGVERTFRSPSDALRCGIAAVTQERSLVPELSVAENLYLGGRMAGNAASINWRATNRAGVDSMRRLGLDLDPALPVRRLSPNQQQLVEIARALATKANYILLDEPTSSLSTNEVMSLLQVLRILRDEGVGVAYVSHRLDEVLAISNVVTVLRDGQAVLSDIASSFTEDRLASEMLGRVPTSLIAATSQSEKPTVLSVQNLYARALVRGASLTVGKGEIVGLAGLEGSGKSELIAAIYGSTQIHSGSIHVGGKQLNRPSPSRSLREKLAYVPPDRKLQGLALDRSVAENLLLGYCGGRSKVRPINANLEAELVASAIDEYLIKCSSPSTEVRRLSGGNQQKVLLARTLLRRPRVLLLDEPTRGVDVGGKREIYELLQRARLKGLGVVVASGDMEELLEVCDRILVMRRGEIVAEADAKASDVETLVAIAAGHGESATDENDSVISRRQT
jgi:ABC-type sugar transport system ATPase subunit